MLEKLKIICERYEELSQQIAAPNAMEDMASWRAMVKEHASLEELVEAAQSYQKTLDTIAECRAMLNDHLDGEMKELVHAELNEQEALAAKQEETLHTLLLPKDPNDDRDVIL